MSDLKECANCKNNKLGIGCFKDSNHCLGPPSSQWDYILWEPKEEVAVGYNDKKFDKGKPRWDLIDMDTAEEEASVLGFGASKYSANSWQGVPDAEGRYFAALMRHLVAYRRGEVLDPDSGLPHLAHARCNVSFLRYFQKNKEK